MPALKTSVTELPESRVRVEAEVPAEEVERRVQQAARKLGGQMRVPGFRKGKVPPPVVIRQLGRETVLDEALRTSLGGWYVEAIDGAGIAPIGEPDLDVGDLPGQGEPLAFSIEIGVRPQAKLGQYKGLEVGRREPADRGLGRRRADRGAARPAGHAGHRRARRGQRRSRRRRLRRQGRRGPVRGGRGSRSADRARVRAADPRLRGAADGRLGRRRAPGQRHLPGGISQRAGRQGRDLRRHRARGQGQAPARARRRLRLRGI